MTSPTPSFSGVANNTVQASSVFTQPTSAPRSPSPIKPFAPQKKTLPARVWFGLAFVILVVVGLVAALVLLNINQDVRQQAYEVVDDGQGYQRPPTPTPYPTPVHVTPAPTGCASFSESVCRQLNNCHWTGSACAEGPPGSCNGFSQSVCVQLSNCQWVSNKCQSITSSQDTNARATPNPEPTAPPKRVVAPGACVDPSTEMCPTGIAFEFVGTILCPSGSQCGTTATISTTQAPREINELCSTSNSELCRYGFIYSCSSPFTPYRKTNRVCGEGTANVGAIVNCCINNTTRSMTIPACQEQGGVVGRCASADACFTAFGPVPRGGVLAGECSQGVKTVLACSLAGIVTSSQSREGCPQPTPNPSATPTTVTLFGQCFSPVDGCDRGRAEHCRIPAHYDFKAQCLAAMEQMNLDTCDLSTTNCSIYDLTVWVPN